MAKSTSKTKSRPRVARANPAAVSAPAEPPAEELPEEPEPAAAGGNASDIDRALDSILPPAPAEEPPASRPADNGAAGEGTEPAAPAAQRAEVKELPPHLRKRTGRPGRRTRRELEKEVKNLREYLHQLEPGADPDQATAAPAVPAAPIDYTEAGEMVGFMLEMVFEAMAEEKGEHWRMTEQKLARAKEHGGRFIGPYLPKLGSFMPLLFFAGVVGKHSLAAWQIDQKRAKNKPATPAPAPAPTGGSE